MRSGKLRHLVTIQRPVETQNDTTGEVTVSWTDVAHVWASVEPLSAREFIAAQAGQSEITTRITIRYRAGIDATMRIVAGVKTYNIQGVLADPKSGQEFITLPCSEVTDGGR